MIKHGAALGAVGLALSFGLSGCQPVGYGEAYYSYASGYPAGYYDSYSYNNAYYYPHRYRRLPDGDGRGGYAYRPDGSGSGVGPVYPDSAGQGRGYSPPSPEAPPIVGSGSGSSGRRTCDPYGCY